MKIFMHKYRDIFPVGLYVWACVQPYLYTEVDGGESPHAGVQYKLSAFRLCSSLITQHWNADATYLQP